MAVSVDVAEERGADVARWLVWVVLGIIGAVAGLVLVFVAKAIYVDWLWFGSLGIENVYLTLLGTQLWLFLAGAGLLYAVLLANLLLARRLASRRWAFWMRRSADGEEAEASAAGDDEVRTPRDVAPLLAGLGALIALGIGWWAKSRWDIVLRLPHQSAFGQSDPLFARDVGFFVFTLPVLQALRTWALWAAILALVGVATVYFFRLIVPQTQGQGFKIEEETGDRRIELAFGPGIRAHLTLLGAIVFALLAWHYRLRMFELVYSGRGATFGAGYTDVNAYWPALWLVLGISIAAAAGLALGVVVRGPSIAIGATALFAVAWLGGTVVYPFFIQRLRVAPNELQLERPFIERNIESTRRAYGLDRVQEEPFAVAEAVTRDEAEANPTTLRNVRLWDYEPLLATYNQIQSIRGYYDFLDADFDRYVIDGEYRQVMIAGRELSPQKLPPDAQTWVNRRLQFTHGYGVVVSPVNEVTPEGLPTLIVQDVPPRGKIRVDRPEIYYGETRADWVLVKTAVPEFDYPRGSENAETTYKGQSGVGIGSFFRRILFAWHLRDINLLVTPALRGDSHILFHRNIRERVHKVAPFLLYDGDPYLVVADGRLIWLYDAYTSSRHYPYSQPATPAFNYLRNSVKIAVDAYDGSMTFYVADSEDPLIRAYDGAFPGLFQPLDRMPAALRAHVRYPTNMFVVQSQMYRLYHMQDPRVFYQREDQLSVPAEVYLGEARPVQPYYAIMRLPGEQREEFVYILPYTPPGKDNMITWLAARSDGAHYGKLVAFKYPKETLIFGPMQVEARIDQDPAISAQFTLWNQGGSRVLRGNMLAIPIGHSNLYVEPIYLQAERSRLPEMKRVVIATGNRVAMGTSVEDALSQLYGGPISIAPVIATAERPPAPSPSTPAGAATTQPAQTTPAAQSTTAAPPAAGAADSPASGAPPTSAPGIGERAALLDAVRSLQQRNTRLLEELQGANADLQRLLNALEGAPESTALDEGREGRRP
ncbi:MAG: UPF0182 family protein [Chloroflexi bacterium]|nr:UPF0182 family protein [Chloroflexota bacterium]